MTSGHAQMVRFLHEDRDVRRLAETCCALGDGLEHGLDVGRRARDDAQDFACRRLLLQGFRDLRTRFRERAILLL